MPGEPPRQPDPAVPWDDVLALFGLTPSVRSPVPVSGGWSHSVWRVETSGGMFVIKEMVENPSSWWIEQLDGAMAFERLAWRSGTLTMAEPIPVSDTEELLGRLSAGELRRAYRCHRWVEGEPCARRSPDPGQSARLGEIVARLASLDVWHGSTADQLAWNALDAYEGTVAEARRTGTDWASLLAELKPHVDSLRQDFKALAARAEPTIVTHRDIDPKNASLLLDGEVALFDWDYAGPRLLAAELLDAAISFAGGPLEADEACIYATIDAYMDIGGHPVSFEHAAAQIEEESFRWIMLNVWRALGHRGVSREQEEFASETARDLLPALAASNEAVRAWARRVQDR